MSQRNRYNRGLLRPGLMADMTIFDLDTVGAMEPKMINDLPGGGPRLLQHSKGTCYTIVNGTMLVENNQHAGADPGQLLRAC